MSVAVAMKLSAAVRALALADDEMRAMAAERKNELDEDHELGMDVAPQPARRQRLRRGGFRIPTDKEEEEWKPRPPPEFY